MASPCTAHNKAGQPCAAQAWQDGLCRWHHPDLEAQRAEARRKGGLGRSNKARAAKALPDAMTPEELAGWLSLVFRQVITRRMEPKVGTAAAAIARTLMVVREMGELEERLAALEARAGQRVL